MRIELEISRVRRKGRRRMRRNERSGSTDSGSFAGNATRNRRREIFCCSVCSAWAPRRVGSCGNNGWAAAARSMKARNKRSLQSVSAGPGRRDSGRFWNFCPAGSERRRNRRRTDRWMNDPNCCARKSDIPGCCCWLWLTILWAAQFWSAEGFPRRWSLPRRKIPPEEGFLERENVDFSSNENIIVELTERNEWEDEFFPAVGATVASRIVQRVGHGTAIAQRQKIFSVLIRLCSNV